MTLFYPKCHYPRLNCAVLLFAFVALINQSVFAQLVTPAPLIHVYENPRPRDTSVQRKRFGRAALFLGIAEVAPFSYDRFIRNVDFSHITFHGEIQHLSPGSWQFDNDPFGTNQFAHPYHGSNFYSAFRANGFSFWQSAPATFAGSFLWETFAENQAPAPNDFINTGFAGTVLGEMTFRLSNRIVNNRSRGFKRQFSEVVGMLINPMNGLTRIMDGKWGRVYGNAKERDSSKISAVFDLGTRSIKGNGSDFGWYGHARLLYGTAYENYRVPFSNILIDAEVGKDDSSKVNIISVYGSLAGWRIQSDEHAKQVGVLSANYDYIHNQSFFYSAQSVKFNLISDFDLGKSIRISSAIGAGPVILAGVPDPYLTRGRNYDYGSGASFSARGSITLANKLQYSINYRGGYIKTINGNSDHFFLHSFSNELSYMFIKNVAFAAEPGVFRLNGSFDNPKFTDLSSRYTYFKASIKYTVQSL
jgi:hypothetical protein